MKNTLYWSWNKNLLPSMIKIANYFLLKTCFFNLSITLSYITLSEQVFFLWMKKLKQKLDSRVDTERMEDKSRSPHWDCTTFVWMQRSNFLGIKHMFKTNTYIKAPWRKFLKLPLISRSSRLRLRCCWHGKIKFKLCKLTCILAL